MSTDRRACPSCGKPVSFWQIVLGPEIYAIKCRQCGARLSKKTRTVAFAIAGTMVIILVQQSYGWLSWQFAAAFMTMLALLTVVALMRVRVTLAGADVDDRPSFPKSPTRDGPPPHTPVPPPKPLEKKD